MPAKNAKMHTHEKVTGSIFARNVRKPGVMFSQKEDSPQI
jgi:hypothetical protein